MAEVASIELNEARFRSAALNYQHSVDSAFTEVDSSLFAYGRSQENQKRIDEATLAVDGAVSKAKSLYRAGLVDYLSVLDAQRQQKIMQGRQTSNSQHHHCCIQSLRRRLASKAESKLL
ncbi:hypothetical protein F0240_10960 [Vibrio kanaloae]|nr:TolC family protein [Vibrio kanaloae]NOJ00345.1 hypothetical protein [Vibrio kanaloae]